jgi:hypothetical protein
VGFQFCQSLLNIVHGDLDIQQWMGIQKVLEDLHAIWGNHDIREMTRVDGVEPEINL